MVGQQPKLRSDLIFSRQAGNGTVSFVIKDPANGQFFRIREPEHFIARQLDGTTGSEEVCRRVAEKFGVQLETEVFQKFVRSLEKNQLLENEPAGCAPEKVRSGRVRGSLFYLRFKAWDPDRFLDRLGGPLRFCFTPGFVAASILVILLGCGVIAFDWDGFKEALPRLYRWSALPLVWAVLMVSTTAHEFAHGLTCKHFGGEVHEMGFLLIYLQPALYCNVSDAWLFPEKSRRLWVGFAGPFFEVLLWGLAALLWRASDPNTWINEAALALTATCGLKACFNFNPLLKLDGYYLLSDWLDLPNLRRRSYAYIGNRFKRLFGSRAELPATPRERRIFLLYGLVASAFSFWVVGLMAVKLGRLLSERHLGLWGFLLALVLLLARVQRRFRRWFPNLPKSRFQRVKAAALAFKRPVIALAALAAAFSVALFGRMELKVTGPFRVLPATQADARAEVEGSVEEVAVDEGSPVKQGELIARLSDRDNLAELRKTEADVAAARARLQSLESGPRREELALAGATVAKAEERVRFARSRLERDEPLFRAGLLARKDFEESQAYLADRENELEEAKRKLNLLQAGSRPEEIEATRAELDRLEAQRHHLEEEVRLARVLSPTSGIVATPSRQLRELVHQWVKKGDLVAKVYELKTLEAETPILEKEIADVAVGQPVALKVRAYPDRTFCGRVASIGTGAQAATDAKDISATRTVLVTARIDNSSLLLKPEMTGNAKVMCGSRRILDLIRRRLARTFEVEFWSWW